VAGLVDTNVLVYRFDGRFPEKQKRATDLLRRGIAILRADEARREAEELLAQFTILYPSEPIVRTALRGMAAYQLSWFDAHLWAYAEHYGLEQLLSEDFQHDRIYGSVRVVNPFLVT
jgi:predicted nucleic acid-binding protein